MSENPLDIFHNLYFQCAFLHTITLENLFGQNITNLYSKTTLKFCYYKIAIFQENSDSHINEK